MKGITKCRWLFAVSLVTAMLAMMTFISTPVFADGAGQPADGSCNTGVKADVGGGVTGNITTSSLTGGNVTATAGTGFIITGVCIKDGDNAFAEPEAGDGPQNTQHSILFTVDGIYGVDNEPSDLLSGCYIISGIGTQTVSVTVAAAVGGNPNCKNISHIDYALMEVQLQEPTSQIVTQIHDPNHNDITNSTLIAPIVIHDQATVTTTVNNIPAGSSVDFSRFNLNGTCTGTPTATENVALSGGSMSETVESSTFDLSTLTVVACRDLSYQGVFNSSDTSTSTGVPNATSTCEKLTLCSSIQEFYYEVSGNIGTCTLEAKAEGAVPGVDCTEPTVTVGTSNTYTVHVGVTNISPSAQLEFVQGGLAANSLLAITSYDAGCAQLTGSVTGGRRSSAITTGSTGNIVTWWAGDPGTTSTNPPCGLGAADGGLPTSSQGFALASGASAHLTATVTKTFTSCGEQPVTSSWSETFTDPVTGSQLKSNYTGRLSVNVTGC